MTTGYNVLLRNAQLDAITQFAGTGAKLRVYNGTRPATGGAATTLLAEFALASPFAPVAAAALLSPPLPANTVGGAAGTASWFRIVKADGTTQVIDGTAGAWVPGDPEPDPEIDLILNTTTISVGVAVAVVAFTIARRNA